MLTISRTAGGMAALTRIGCVLIPCVCLFGCLGTGSPSANDMRPSEGREVVAGSVAGIEEAAKRAAEIRGSELPLQARREQLARLIVPGMTVPEVESVLGERHGVIFGTYGGGEYWYDAAGIWVVFDECDGDAKARGAGALH